MSEKFILTYGIHRGTLMSRDTAEPEEFNTEEEAIDKLNEHKRWYASIGYVIWFADLKRPDGTEIQVCSNPYQ